jgi:hypothetical protein
MPLRWRAGFVATICFASSACSSIGPVAVQYDRIDYSSAIATSWKDQMVLNIVKFRYLDAPVFLDVASVVSSRELRTEASITPQFFPKSPVDSNIQGELNGRYTDHPTVSYTPLTGERLLNSQLRPIPPELIFSLIEAGHDAGFILHVTVRAINGVYNHYVALDDDLQPHTAFAPLGVALRRIQLARGMGTRTVKTQGQERTWIFFRRGLSPDVQKDIRYVQRVLGLDPNRREYLLTASAQAHPNEIGLLTRSLHEIMAELSVGVEVSAADLEAGRAARFGRLATEDQTHLHIQSGEVRPINAYAAAYYRNRWFWIDDEDLHSKRVFMVLLMVTSLAESSAQQHVPVLTTSTR